jgi:DNA recombination protein RmuC
MASIIPVLFLLVGISIGFFLATRLSKAKTALMVAETEGRFKPELAAANAKLEAAALEKEQLRDTFNGVAAEALRKNNESFLQLAKTELARESTAAKSDLDKREKAITDLVGPIQKGLEAYQSKLADIEKERTSTFGSLRAEILTVAKSNRDLEVQTKTLVTALKAPPVRGKWGEVQLRNAVELAGMVQHCDFEPQHHVVTEDGSLRPDMTINLPGGRTIVVDAKVSMAAYLEAVEEADDTKRAECFKRHAGQIRTHAKDLKKKAYWEQFPKSPEFVVMFIPAESLFSAALQADPGLLEELMADNVILATPTTLIALLKTAAHGWVQELIVRDAEQISSLGKELYARMTTLCNEIAKIGKGLDSAVKAYNSSVGMLESRFIVTGRRFKGMGAVATNEIRILEPVASTLREVTVPELTLIPPPTVRVA